MANEGKTINFNNAETVVDKLKKEPFSDEFVRMSINESGIGEVTISDESIQNNSDMIVNLFDEQ